jgi:hypothetical protein
MLLLEGETIGQVEEVKGEAMLEIEAPEVVDEEVDTIEEESIAVEVVIDEVQESIEMTEVILQEVDSADISIESAEYADHFMEAEDADVMIDAQIEADALWMASIESTIEAEAEVEIAPDFELETEVMIEDEASFVSEEISLTVATEEVVEAFEEPAAAADDASAFSFPASVSASFDPFPVDQNDNGIRIDPSIPFIRIPDAAPRAEEAADDITEDLTEVRASFMDTFAGDVVDFGTDAPAEFSMEIPVEIKASKPVPARTIIPRQLTSPEAFELREASGTMIIIREEEDYTEEHEADVDRRQQGGPELRGSEPLENEEPKFKISAVPTAEPGYEPGYTNQQRTTRKPVTVQPENTRRWF